MAREKDRQIELAQKRLVMMVPSQIELLLEGLELVAERCPQTQAQQEMRHRANSLLCYLIGGPVRAR